MTLWTFTSGGIAWCVTISYNKPQQATTHLKTDHNTPHHNTPQHVATHHTTLQQATTSHNTPQNTPQHTTARHNTPQHVATHHTTPQHATTHHNTLVHASTRQDTSRHATDVTVYWWPCIMLLRKVSHPKIYDPLQPLVIGGLSLHWWREGAVVRDLRCSDKTIV